MAPRGSEISWKVHRGQIEGRCSVSGAQVEMSEVRQLSFVFSISGGQMLDLFM